MSGRLKLVTDVLVNEGFFHDYLSAKDAITRKKAAIAGNFVTTESCLFSGTTFKFEIADLPKGWEPVSRHVTQIKEKGTVVIYKGNKFPGTIPWNVRVQNDYKYNEVSLREKQEEEKVDESK